MSKQQLLIGLTFTLLTVAGATVWGQNPSRGSDDGLDVKTTDSASVVNRRSTLPSGWFKQGKPAALTDTQVAAVEPAAHFDAFGEKDSDSRTLRNMRRVRSAEVFKGWTGKVSAANDAVDAGAKSSRRRAVKSSVSTEVRPTRQPSAAERVARAKSVPSETMPLKDAEPASIPKEVVAIQTPTANVKESLTAKPNPNQERTPVILDGDSLVEKPAQQLPSVMKPAKLRHDMSDATKQTTNMKLTAIETQQAGESISKGSLDEIAGVQSAETSALLDEAGDTVLIENYSPMLSVLTKGPKTIVVGKPAKYVVDLKNQSDGSAKELTVRVTVPHWVEVVDQRPTRGVAHIQPDDSGQSVVTWRISQIDGQAQEQLMLELIPRGSRPVDLGVTWAFSPAKMVTQIQVQEPKLQMSVVGPQDVLYGDTRVYTVTVTNPGTGDAENVVLNLLPLVPGEQTAGVRNLGTIRAGERQTIEVELTTRQTGRLYVRAEAVADAGLHAKAQQEVLVRRAILEVVVDGPPSKYAGTRARYTVRIANSGDAPATDVNVVATLPAGAKEVASSDGGSLDPSTRQVHWRLGILRPGATRVLELESMLSEAGDNRMDVRTVAAGDLSALGAAVTQVESLADLKLIVNDPQGAVAVGADVAYEVKIMNRGTKEADNIQLFGYFSKGVEPVSIAGWRGNLKEGEVVLQKIPRLGPGQEMVIRIMAQADRPGDHVFRAELECTSPKTKLAVEEWTRFYGDGPVVQRQASQPARRQAPTKKMKLQRY